MDTVNTIKSLILKAGHLPGYKIHPYDTYSEIKKVIGIYEINHPKDLFLYDVGQLHLAAEHIIGTHKRKFALTGFLTGVPGGIAGLAGGTAIDIEEYLRRLFLLAQQVGHVFGLIPNPFAPELDETLNSYFEAVKEDILKAMLIGLGTGLITMGVTETAKLIAEKQAADIAQKKISEKTITVLAMQIAKALGVKLTKEGLAQMVRRVVPIIGGGINAAANYKAVDVIGDNLINNFKQEHIRVKPLVISQWKLNHDDKQFS